MLVACLEMDLPGLAIILQAALTPETGQRKAKEKLLKEVFNRNGTGKAIDMLVKDLKVL